MDRVGSCCDCLSLDLCIQVDIDLKTSIDLVFIIVTSFWYGCYFIPLLTVFSNKWSATFPVEYGDPSSTCEQTGADSCGGVMGAHPLNICIVWIVRGRVRQFQVETLIPCQFYHFNFLIVLPQKISTLPKRYLHCTHSRRIFQKFNFKKFLVCPPPPNLKSWIRPCMEPFNPAWTDELSDKTRKSIIRCLKI